MDNDKQFKIMIVDDEKSNIDALIHILKPLYNVAVAKNGTSALEIARRCDPDLILLDVVMPDISGFDVLTALKDDNITRDIPVIFITGRDNVEDEERGFALGALDYITKPFHDSVVEARVRTHLRLVDYIRTIERKCMIDPLTNIPNRRRFDERLNQEWYRSIREKTPLSILMIDVDKFKSYNDMYGHLQGDTLLQELSLIFEKSMRRATDLVARWGGEEFSVLLVNTCREGAMLVAESIRSCVELAIVPLKDGQDTRVTISIGVNTIIPTNDDSVTDFIAGADKALYHAKRTGRNRVTDISEI